MKLYFITFKIWNWTYSGFIDRFIDRFKFSIGVDEEDAINRVKSVVDNDARDFEAELIETVMDHNIIVE